MKKQDERIQKARQLVINNTGLEPEQLGVPIAHYLNRKEIVFAKNRRTLRVYLKEIILQRKSEAIKIATSLLFVLLIAGLLILHISGSTILSYEEKTAIVVIFLILQIIPALSYVIIEHHIIRCEDICQDKLLIVYL